MTIDSNAYPMLVAIACPSTNQCTALDYHFAEVTFNPTSPGPPTYVGMDSPNGLYGLACPTTTQCTAVDQNGAELTFNPTSPGTPTPVTIDNGGFSDGIACPSTTQCTAVDKDGAEATFNPTSPGTPTPVAIDSGQVLTGVACPSTTQCVAVDGNGRALEGDPTTSGAWTVEPVPNATGLYAVSCPTTTECVTVDATGDESTGTGSAPPLTPPVSTSPPSISGTTTQGQTLTESPGAWTNSPTSYAYQWEDCDSSGNNCGAIAGATGQTYTLTAADVAETIRVQETATNSAGPSTPATSAAIGPVQAASIPPTKPSNSEPPVISGTTTVGHTLTSTTGAWSGSPPISYSYQWVRCATSCAVIAGATLSTYTLTAADVGAKIAVLVTAANAAGSSEATSSALGPIVGAGGPASSKITAALDKALAISGPPAKIAQLLKHHGYTTTFSSPTPGHLTIACQLVQNSVRAAKVAKPTLLATANVTFRTARKGKVTIALTAKGRQLLKHAKRLKLTAKGTFTPTGTTTSTTTAKTITIAR